MDEEWVEVEDFSRYIVSNTGRLINVVLNHELRGSVNVHGYRMMTMNDEEGIRQFVLMHRLVAYHFVDGYREGFQVNHIDGNKLNNYAENLEWVSQRANLEHARQSGLNTSHKRNMIKGRPFISVETDQVFQTQVECANMLGVSHVQIGKVLKSDGRLTAKKCHLRYI